MPLFAWLTPDTTPTLSKCRCLVIPDDPSWLAIVSGALVELTRAYNFEEFGSVTPQECADTFQAVFDEFSGGRMCREVGEIIPFAGETSPISRWLRCDGASLVRADYPDLFAVIGTAYGSVDGTHFNIPDLRGHVPLGVGQSPGTNDWTLGLSFGEESHPLSVAEMPIHNHTQDAHNHNYFAAQVSLVPAGPLAPVPSAVQVFIADNLVQPTIQNSGGNEAHNNVQPTLAINFLIVAKR